MAYLKTVTHEFSDGSKVVHHFDEAGNKVGEAEDAPGTPPVVAPPEVAYAYPDSSQPGGVRVEGEKRVGEIKQVEQSPVPVAEPEPEEPNHVKQGKLPEDFPAHAALADAGIHTYAQVRKAIKAETLTDIPGIGEATAAKIAEAMEK